MRPIIKNKKNRLLEIISDCMICHIMCDEKNSMFNNIVSNLYPLFMACRNHNAYHDGNGFQNFLLRKLL